MYHFAHFLWWGVDDDCCFERCAEPGCHDRLSLDVWEILGGTCVVQVYLGRLRVAKAKLVCACK
jgi:hypothetical protein